MSQTYGGDEPQFTREACQKFCQYLVKMNLLSATGAANGLIYYNSAFGLSTHKLGDGAKLFLSAMLSRDPTIQLGMLPGQFVREWMGEAYGIYQAHPSGRTTAVAPVSSDGPTAARPSKRQSKPQQQMIGRYRVDRLLAKGGMGEVYIGRHPDIDVQVAIKTIRPEMADDEGLARFRLEAKTLWALDHPNLLRCHEVDFQNEPHFIVMPFIDGQTLDAVFMKRRPNNDLLWRVELMRDVCRGVAHMHANRLVHRDLKPKNIFVDKTGRPVVGDPGLVKKMGIKEAVAKFDGGKSPETASTDLTQFGTVMGTIPYMAPEQGEGDPNKITPAADVYSLGKILFEVWTLGVPVHSGTQPMAILAKVFEAQIPDVVYDELRKKIYQRHDPQRAIDIVVRCLQHDPAARYKDAGELAEALDAYATWLRDHEAEEEKQRQANYEALRRRSKIVGGFAALGLITAVLAIFAFVNASVAKTEAEGRAIAEADARNKAEALVAVETSASAAARLRVQLADDLGRAQTLVKNANWTEAELILLGIIRKDETYAPARMLLADVQFNLVKYSCTDHWLWLAQHGPEADRQRNAFMAVFGEQQLPDPAALRGVAVLAQAVKDEPYAALAQVLVRLDEAEQCRTQGRTSDAEAKLHEAEQLADSAIISPESEWLVCYVRGRVQHQAVAVANSFQQRPPELMEACQFYERSAVINPDFVLAWFFFGESAKQLGLYRLAQTAYLRGLQLVPHLSLMLYSYADTLYEWANTHLLVRRECAKQGRPLPGSTPPIDDTLAMLTKAITLCLRANEENLFRNEEQRHLSSFVLVKAYAGRYAGLMMSGRNQEAAQVRTDAAKIVANIEAMKELRPFELTRLAELRQELGFPPR